MRSPAHPLLARIAVGLPPNRCGKPSEPPAPSGYPRRSRMPLLTPEAAQGWPVAHANEAESVSESVSERSESDWRDWEKEGRNASQERDGGDHRGRRFRNERGLSPGGSGRRRRP